MEKPKRARKRKLDTSQGGPEATSLQQRIELKEIEPLAIRQAAETLTKIEPGTAGFSGPTPG
jgi:hypothetical protein